MITPNELKAQKDFLSKRVKNITTESLLAQISECEAKYKAGCTFSSRTTSTSRLANIFQYEILLEVLKERLNDKYEVSHLNSEIEKFQSKIDSIKKILES
jgi:hypothetical protein